MTTGWLLLLVMVISSENSNAQTWTDAKVDDGKLLSQLERAVDMKSEQQRMLKNRQVGPSKQEVLEELERVHSDMERLNTSLHEIKANQREIRSHHQQILEELEKLGSHQENQRLRDCAAIYNTGERSNGVYTIYVGSAQRPIEVPCDMTTDGGGWTVFQRRQDGSEDFYRNWTDYFTGFGNVSGEFWLGNEKLHLLTTAGCQQLRADLADFEGNTAHAKYSSFGVDSALEDYKLLPLGMYTGNAGDSLGLHARMKFTTRDRDNDWTSWGNMAQRYQGAWWYKQYHYSNLNGLYLRGANITDDQYGEGVQWRDWRDEYSLRFTEMKIRPCDF